MNIKAGLFFVLCFAVVHRAAGFQVPRFVYEIDQLEQAMAEAESRGRGLAFLFTNPESTCGLSHAASLNAIDELRRHSTIVIIRPQQSLTQWVWQVSPPLLYALFAPGMVGTIPRIVVTSPDQTLILGALSYAETKNSRNYRELWRKVRGFTGYLTDDVDQTPIGSWYIGQSYLHATWVRTEGGAVILRNANTGIEGKHRFDSLTSGAVAYVRVLEEAARSAAPPPPTEVIREWICPAGRVLHASFVDLQGETITIKAGSGKVLTFPTNLLSEESRALAHRLVMGEALE